MAALCEVTGGNNGVGLEIEGCCWCWCCCWECADCEFEEECLESGGATGASTTVPPLLTVSPGVGRRSVGETGMESTEFTDPGDE